MTGYAGSRDYVGTPQRTPHRSTHSPEKQTPTLSKEFNVSCELFEVTRTESVIQWDVWISVGSSAETTGSIRNPETWRTPS